jgi:hypothetical protein
MLDLLLTQEDVLDEPLEGEVCEPEVRADDHARDQHDRDALDQLLLARPLDLLQLGGGLADEAPEAGAGNLPLGSDGCGLGGTDRGGPLRARVGAVSLLAELLGSTSAALSPRLPSH